MTIPIPAASDTVTTSRQRLRRLIRALACASFDRFDVPEAQIEPDESDEFGMLEGVLRSFIDELAVTRTTLEMALSESEEARAELEERLRTIEQQRTTIAELSTPVIELWEGVLTVPLVGVMDTQRAAELSDRVLLQVAATSARFLLVDLTGVEVVDTATASHLLRLVQAVRLLGAECLLTGLRPTVALALSQLGVELGGTRTVRSLREGLRYCLAQRHAQSLASRRATL